MGLFSGSFGTGFVTGLAGSVDRSLQDAITRRNSEMSDARKYIQTRRATKLDAYEAKKQKFDEETQLAFDALARELGDDVDLTYAAFKRLGTAADVQNYIADVKTTRKALPAGQKYDARADFTGVTKGDTRLTRSAALGQLGLDGPKLAVGTVSAADFAVDDPIGRLFGTENKAAEDAAKRLNKQFASTAPAAGPERMTGLTTVGGIDLSRQTAAEEAAYTRKSREREGTEFNMKVSAFKQNERVVEEKLRLAKEAEERLRLAQDNTFAQQEYQNAVDAAERIKRFAQYDRQAEIHVLEKRAAEQGITLKDLQIKTEREGPQFSDFEEMAVYYANRLADPGLTTQQKNDFEALRDQAISNAASYNAQTSTTTSPKSFSTESRTNVYNAAVRKELGPYGLIDELGAEIAEEIEGNQLTYFAGMNRALTALDAQTSPLGDQQFKTIIDSAALSLKERVNQYKANPENLLDDDKQPQNGDEAYTPQFTSTLQAGDVVKYSTPQGEVSMIWLGTRYYTPPQFGS